MTSTLSKGEQTRERILDIAETSVLQKGFAATSIDELTAAAEITKSGFLYHFRDKTDLARQLLERYLRRDDDFFDGLEERARELDDDPLHCFPIFLRLMAEALDDMPNTHPGCLAASFSYQEHLFDQEIRDLNKKIVQSWRDRFHRQLQEIAEKYPYPDDIDLLDLADNVSTLIEGGIVLEKALGEHGVLKRQLLVGRDHVKRVFSS